MVKLPFVRRQKPAADPPPFAPGSASSTTVLIVENEIILRSLFANALRRDGYRVLEADHGVQALALAQQADRIDMVVTDVHMPKMDGIELGAKLRESYPNLPILYVSGYPLDESELVPHSDVLQKPFAWQALRDKTVQAVGLPAPLEAA
jgi:two-component system cell cycle sensor histidine kinase/response regulator CckA